MYKLLFILMIFSTQTFSQEKELEKLMGTYLKSLNTLNYNELEKITSKTYFKKLKESYKVKNADQKTKEKYIFDLKYKKASLEKDLYFVNIKDKKDKDFHEYWYLVKKIKNDFIITDMKMLED